MGGPPPMSWQLQISLFGLWTLTHSLQIVLTCSKFPLIICKSGWIIWQRSCSWCEETRNLSSKRGVDLQKLLPAVAIKVQSLLPLFTVSQCLHQDHHHHDHHHNHEWTLFRLVFHTLFCIMFTKWSLECDNETGIEIMRRSASDCSTNLQPEHNGWYGWATHIRLYP